MVFKIRVAVGRGDGLGFGVRNRHSSLCPLNDIRHSSRKDKSDKGVHKFDLTKGTSYQVDIQNGGEARDGVKEDRG
jgi:hypothetical protein